MWPICSKELLDIISRMWRRALAATIDVGLGLLVIADFAN